MKNKKGFLLAESLAAVAIFVIIISAVFSLYMSIETALKRQREYVAFEGICLDIGFYGDRYGRGWAEEYFSGATTYGDGVNTVCYYNSSFAPTSFKEEAEYALSYFYSDGGSLILSVNRINGGSVISSLDYGPARYDEKYCDILDMLSAIKADVGGACVRPDWAEALSFGDAAEEEGDGEFYFVYYLDASLKEAEKSEAIYKLYYSYVLNDGENALYVFVDNISLGYTIIDGERYKVE